MPCPLSHSASRCLPASTSGRPSTAVVFGLSSNRRHCYDKRQVPTRVAPATFGTRLAAQLSQPAAAAAAAAAAADGREWDPILVGVNCDREAAAMALVKDLRRAGSSEVWATGAANHYQAVGVLATAQQLLQQDRQPAGLIATVSIHKPDFTPSEQAQRLRKMVFTVKLTPEPVNFTPWSDPSSRTSGNNTKDFEVLTAAVKQGLTRQDPAPGAVFEARGEQAVTRVLKTLLGTQMQLQQQLQLLPVWGPVVDAAAAKRGEQVMVPGILLWVLGTEFRFQFATAY